MTNCVMGKAVFNLSYYNVVFGSTRLSMKLYIGPISRETLVSKFRLD